MRDGSTPEWGLLVAFGPQGASLRRNMGFWGAIWGLFLRFLKVAAERAFLSPSTGCLESLSFRPGVSTSPMGRPQEHYLPALESASGHIPTPRYGLLKGHLGACLLQAGSLLLAGLQTDRLAGCGLAGWLAGWLLSSLAGWLVAGWLVAGWLVAGGLPGCWLAGCWRAALLLAGWMAAGWLAGK